MVIAKIVAATQMADGQTGVSINIDEGHVLQTCLEFLGIRPGKRIRKVSASFMRSLLLIDVEGSEIAIGFGMANRIFAKVE
jgi:ferrous iron transport protein A